MKYNFIISSYAEIKIDLTVNYILENWGLKSQQDFLLELKRSLVIIENNPLSFPVSLKSSVIRECVVTPLNKLYYTIREKDIIILSMEDTRMNLDNLKF